LEFGVGDGNGDGGGKKRKYAVSPARDWFDSIDIDHYLEILSKINQFAECQWWLTHCWIGNKWLKVVYRIAV
jgi:hypothetical protein